LPENLLETFKTPYRQWYTRIKDEKAQIAISNRITRLRVGNFGDFKRLGQDLYELRIHYGPGYRAYFGVFQNDIVILLCGGDKGTQQRDITRARNYWYDFLERMKE
jgi:putative addiction module killer protein